MKKKKETRCIRVSATTHRGLLKLAELEVRNVSDIAERLLSPAVEAVLAAQRPHYNRSGDQHPED